MNEIKKTVKYNKIAQEYLKKLDSILFANNYFGFRENAVKYVINMRDYVENYISIIPHYPAPEYFAKYGKNMEYIIYPANKQTTWYFFFKQKENNFLVCYITNNHFEGQYIR